MPPRPPLPDLGPIPWFDRDDHPFVPTCRPAERRAQWKSPRRGRSTAEHRALARLTERARRYTPKQGPPARRRPAGLLPRNVLDYWWGVHPLLPIQARPHSIWLRTKGNAAITCTKGALATVLLSVSC